MNGTDRDMKALLIDSLKEILPIYSPSYEEAAMGAYIHARLLSNDWGVTRDDMGNIMAVRGARPDAGFPIPPSGRSAAGS